MSHWEQFEVWAERGGRWELIGSFRDFPVASAVARNYHYRMRLVHAVYQDEQRAEETVIAELGATRREP